MVPLSITAALSPERPLPAGRGLSGDRAAVIDNGTMKVEGQTLTSTEEFEHSDVSPIARGHDLPVYFHEFTDAQFFDIQLAEW